MLMIVLVVVAVPLLLILLYGVGLMLDCSAAPKPAQQERPKVEHKPWDMPVLIGVILATVVAIAYIIA